MLRSIYFRLPSDRAAVHVLQVVCHPALPEAVAAARPFLPGLLQALKPTAAGAPATAGSALGRDPRWLRPIAHLLAPAAAEGAAQDGAAGGAPGPTAGAELAAAASRQQGAKGRRRSNRRSSAQNENQDSNVVDDREPATGAESAKEAGNRAAGPAAAQAPAVKALLHAAGLSKVGLQADGVGCEHFHASWQIERKGARTQLQLKRKRQFGRVSDALQTKDALMDLAVQLAVASWPAASDAASVLGALELAQLCGLKPQVHQASNSTHTRCFHTVL
jgi:hypothetical protein